jgi:hypothetical protein
MAQLAKVPQWSLSSHRWIPWPTEAEPSIRLLIDNDLAGDSDDLFQIVRHLLSQSVDIQAIICSQLGPDDSDRRATAADALLVARHVFHRMLQDMRTEGGDVSSNEFVGKPRSTARTQEPMRISTEPGPCGSTPRSTTGSCSRTSS